MFEKFPKIPRLRRGCTITEKIDGTNAQIYIDVINDVAGGAHRALRFHGFIPPLAEHNGFGIWAGSRKRWVIPTEDNYGWAKWVLDHADELIEGLGPGRHFGEWWGATIQRRYGLDHRKFSLFNTKMWTHNPRPECCDVVPIIYEGTFTDDAVEQSIQLLRDCGSLAAPWFMKPEGIVVHHTASNHLFKVMLENDDIPKGAM